ncbi:hypothetical protein WMY93_004693 [Mugilogobius chulae]|uniref:Amino acid transporter n=1 Tax=Mugilogobius chulae TaxID=88201 RepID=A0AAW0PP88_9GOBI
MELTNNRLPAKKSARDGKGKTPEKKLLNLSSVKSPLEEKQRKKTRGVYSLRPQTSSLHPLLHLFCSSLQKAQVKRCSNQLITNGTAFTTSPKLNISERICQRCLLLRPKDHDSEQWGQRSKGPPGLQQVRARIQARSEMARQRVQNITKDDVKGCFMKNAFVIFTVAAVIIGIILGFAMRKFHLSYREVKFFSFPGELLMRMLQMLVLPCWSPVSLQVWPLWTAVLQEKWA